MIKLAALALLAAGPGPARGEEAHVDGPGLLEEVLRHVTRDHAAGRRLGRQELVRGAVTGALDRLGDRYSRYVPPEDSDALTSARAGRYAGVGVLVTQRDDVFEVVACVPGSPADRAGLLPGDRLCAVDGRDLAGLGMPELRRLLRGPPDTTVRVAARASGDAGDPRDHLLRRVALRLPSVGGWRLPGDVGYLRIGGFLHETVAELRRALEHLEAESPLEALVVDLRGNPGGSFHAALDVARSFLGREPIVTVEADLGMRTRYLGDGRGRREIPLVVLQDRDSASSSEIVAAALAEAGRALLIGGRSHGKGTVQSVRTLSDGGALVLTTARYRTPRGQLVHGRGLTPHVEVPPRPRQTRMEWEGQLLRAPASSLLEPLPEDLPLRRALVLLADARRLAASTAPAQAAGPAARANR